MDSFLTIRVALSHVVTMVTAKNIVNAGANYSTTVLSGDKSR